MSKIRVIAELTGTQDKAAGYQVTPEGIRPFGSRPGPPSPDGSAAASADRADASPHGACNSIWRNHVQTHGMAALQELEVHTWPHSAQTILLRHGAMTDRFPFLRVRLAERSRVISWIDARAIEDAQHQLVTSYSRAGEITWSVWQCNTAKMSRSAALMSCPLVSRSMRWMVLRVTALLVIVVFRNLSKNETRFFCFSRLYPFHTLQIADFNVATA